MTTVDTPARTEAPAGTGALARTDAPAGSAVPGGRRTAEALRRAELGAFLRSRRERITPADVGLPAIGRRRTPGLRREEVAQVAGVGVTWYTWLEQGRDITVSDQVLDAVGPDAVPTPPGVVDHALSGRSFGVSRPESA